jgi:hypothetical protein
MLYCPANVCDDSTIYMIEDGANSVKRGKKTIRAAGFDYCCLASYDTIERLYECPETKSLVTDTPMCINTDIVALSVSKSFWNYLQYTEVLYSPWITATLAVFGALLLFFTFKKIYDFFAEGDEITAQTQIAYDPTDHKATAKKVKQSSRPQIKSRNLQMLPDTDGAAIVAIQKNMFFIHEDSIETSVAALKKQPIMALGGKTFLVNYHSWTVMSAGCKEDITLTNNTGTVLKIKKSKLTVTALDPYDFVLITAPNISSLPSIVKFFVRSNIKTTPTSNMSMFEFDRTGNMKSTSLQLTEAFVTIEGEYKLAGFSYPREGPGMCGSLLFDTKSEKIYGIHNAGAKGTGYCHRFDYEDFAIVKSQDSVFTSSIKKTDNDDKVFVEVGGVLQCLRDIVEVIDEDHKEVNYVLKTKIEPSIVADKFETFKFPPIYKHPHDRVRGEHAILNGLRKRSEVVLPFPDKIKQVHKFMCNIYLTKCKPVSLPVKQILTMQDAIFGSDLDFHVPLDLNTSAGYPHALDKNSNGKKHLIQFEESIPRRKLTGIRQDLHNEIEHIVKNAALGIRDIVPYMVSIKDERMTVEKRDKPRIIDCCPIQLTIPLNQYTRSFCAAFQSSRRDLGHSVGIDKNSMEWSDLAWRFLKISNKGLSIDFRSLGPTMENQILSLVHELICQWYKYHNSTEEENKIRRNLLRHNEACYEVVWNYLFRNHNGSPSGSPLTVIVNSIAVQYMIAMAWYDLVGDLISYQNIFTNVYGDDFIIAIPDEYIEKFNGHTLANYLLNFNVHITVADQKGTVKQIQQFNEISFLKSFFVPHPFRTPFYMPHYTRKTITDALCWNKNKDLAIQQDSMRMILEMAYGLGEEEYEELCKICQEAWLNGPRQPFIYRTWTDIDNEIFNEKQGLVTVSGP